MSLSVSASRFACLPDDDSTDWKGPKSKTKSKKEDTSKKSTENKPKDKNKLKAQKEAKELQNIAFGGQKKKKKKGKQEDQQTPQTPSKSSTPKEVSPPVEDNVPDKTVNGAQYDEWQKKDKIQAEDNFSNAMQEAILLSKLEFEQQEAEIAAQKRLMIDGTGNPGDEQLLTTMSKEDRKKVIKAGKAASVMSLDQFNATDQTNKQEVIESDVQAGVYKHPRHKDRHPGDVQPEQHKDKLISNPRQKDRQVSVLKTEDSQLDFFNQTDQAALKAINREQLMDSFRNQEAVDASESALVANYKEKFTVKETEVNLLRSEVADLKEKMTDCKTRSKKLTEILMTGEMKEKTEVLVQVQQLEKVRDELTTSLSVTTGHLEQERSLNRLLEQELKRLSLQEIPVEKEVVNRLLAIIRAKK